MNTTMPSKETVRKWLKHEVIQHRPPPDPQQIRRELGWGLLKQHGNNGQPGALVGVNTRIRERCPWYQE
jgi:hypothetical protein